MSRPATSAGSLHRPLTRILIRISSFYIYSPNIYTRLVFTDVRSLLILYIEYFNPSFLPHAINDPLLLIKNPICATLKWLLSAVVIIFADLNAVLWTLTHSTPFPRNLSISVIMMSYRIIAIWFRLSLSVPNITYGHKQDALRTSSSANGKH